jgi:hypothetical protein
MAIVGYPQCTPLATVGQTARRLPHVGQAGVDAHLDDEFELVSA